MDHSNRFGATSHQPIERNSPTLCLEHTEVFASLCLWTFQSDWTWSNVTPNKLLRETIRHCAWNKMIFQSTNPITSLFLLSACTMIARVSLFYYSIHYVTTSITVLINGAPVTISDPHHISKACSKMNDVTLCHSSIVQQLAKAQTIAHEQFNKCSYLQWGIGWCNVQRVDFDAYVLPIVFRPTDNIQTVCQWESTDKQAINMHKTDMKFQSSSTIETLFVLLPACAIGCMFTSPTRSSNTTPLLSIPLQESIASVRFVLVALVVLGHAYQLCQVKDPWQSTIGIEMSSVACSCVFFMSGMGTASRKFTVDTCIKKIKRLWIFCGGMLVMSTALGVVQLSPEIVIQTMGLNFLDFTATPTNRILKHVAPSLWSIPLTMQCWYIMVLLESLNRKNSAVLLTIVSSLLATKASYYMISFFTGSLFVLVARDLNWDIYTNIPFLKCFLALIPWSLGILTSVSTTTTTTSSAASTPTFFPAMFCFILCIIQKLHQMEVDTVHIRGILSALNKGAVFIFCGSSMLQLLLIRSNIATTPFWNFFVSMVVLLFFTFVFNVAGYTKGCNRSLFNRNNQVLFLILFLAIGCAKGSENGEILAGQVGIT